MFRLSVNIGGAFDLYVSKVASDDLRTFAPPTVLTEGYSDNAFIDLLRFDARADYGRARHVILLTEAGMDSDSRSRIRTYLERRLRKELDNLIEARNRENVADDRRRIYNVCEQLDNSLELHLSHDDAVTADESDSDAYVWLDDESEDVDDKQQQRNGDEILEVDRTDTIEWIGDSSPMDEAEAKSYSSEYRPSDDWNKSLKEEQVSHRENGAYPYPFWPIMAVVTFLVVWSVGASVGMYVVYSDIKGLRTEVTMIRSRVDSLMLSSESGSSTASHIQELAGNIRYIRSSLSESGSTEETSPLMEAVRSLNSDIKTLKKEFVYEKGEPKSGSLMETVHLLDKKSLQVLNERILSDMSNVIKELTGRLESLQREVGKLTDTEDRKSPTMAMKTLVKEIGDLRTRIRELTDGTRKDSLAYAIERLDSEMRNFRTARLYSINNKECEGIQRALKALKFYDDDVDGKCGSGTERAIANFQRVNKLQQTGGLTASDVRILRDATRAKALD